MTAEAESSFDKRYGGQNVRGNIPCDRNQTEAIDCYTSSDIVFTVTANRLAR